MDAIILFSHGSLLCGAGETLRAHARRLRESAVAPRVEVGFLNFSEPDFLTTVAGLVSEGATQIRIAPYFLIPGKFVKVDLPRRMDEAKTQFSQVEFTVAEPLGFDPRLADALLHSAAHAKPPLTGTTPSTKRPHTVAPTHNVPFTIPHSARNRAAPDNCPKSLVFLRSRTRPLTGRKKQRCLSWYTVRHARLRTRRCIASSNCSKPAKILTQF